MAISLKEPSGPRQAKPWDRYRANTELSAADSRLMEAFWGLLGALRCITFITRSRHGRTLRTHAKSTNANGGTTGTLCLDEAQLWTDWMNQNKISWTAWKLDDCPDLPRYFQSRGTCRWWQDRRSAQWAPAIRKRSNEGIGDDLAAPIGRHRCWGLGSTPAHWALTSRPHSNSRVFG